MPPASIPRERPRAQKRFLTTREVSEMAAAGITHITSSDEVVITDAARELADALGFRITKYADAPANAKEDARSQGARPHDRSSGGVIPTDSNHNIMEAIVSVFQDMGKHSPSAAEVREVAQRVLNARRRS